MGSSEAIASGPVDSAVEGGTQASSEGCADSVRGIVIGGRSIDAARSPPYGVSLNLQQSWKDKGTAAKDCGPKDSYGHDHVDGFLIDAQEGSHQKNNQGDETDVVHGKKELLGFTECRSKISSLPCQHTTSQYQASLED